MLSKSEVGACDREGGRLPAGPPRSHFFRRVLVFFSLWTRLRGEYGLEGAGKFLGEMRGNNDSCCIICFINVLIIRYTNGGEGGRLKRVFTQGGVERIHHRDCSSLLIRAC